MSEETIVPLARRLVKNAVQGVLVHSFRINHIGHSLNTIESSRAANKTCQGLVLPMPMLNLLDLVQLENLRYPAFSGNETALSTDFKNEFAPAKYLGLQGCSQPQGIHREKTTVAWLTKFNPYPCD